MYFNKVARILWQMTSSAFMRDDRLQKNLRDAEKKITEYKAVVERYDYVFSMHLFQHEKTKKKAKTNCLKPTTKTFV